MKYPKSFFQQVIRKSNFIFITKKLMKTYPLEVNKN